MASTRVLGTCRGVRVPHLLPDKWNLNTADQRVSLSGYSACGGPVYWCRCRRTRCSGQPSVKTQTREYVARTSHRSVDVRHPLKMQTSATVYKRKEKLVLCLDTSVGRGTGSYPVCRRFESCSRHQCLQMDVLSSPWPRCLIPDRKRPQCSRMRKTLLGVTRGSGSVS